MVLKMTIELKIKRAGEDAETLLSPASLAEAFAAIKDEAKTADKDHRASATLTLGAGDYTLDEPLVLDAEENAGLAYTALTVEGVEGTRLTGEKFLTASDFEKVEGKPYYICRFPEKDGEYPAFEDFYVDGVRIPMASSETFIHPFPYESRVKEDPVNFVGLYLPEDMVRKIVDADAIVPTHIMMFIEWHFKSIEMASVDFDDKREKDGVSYVRVHLKDNYMELLNSINGFLSIQNREFYFLNCPAYLTPGTFTYNPYRGELLYYPADTLEGHKYGVSTLENLITLKGMSNITFKSVAFSGATTGYRIKNSYFSGQANCESRVRRLSHAALITHDVRNVLFDGCSFSELGANGLQMKDASTSVTIINCRFTHIGMSALSVGNPESNWSNPKNRNINIRIENNLIEDIGYTYPSAVALYVGMVDTLVLSHNTIRKCAYSGVSVGWGWSRVGYELGESVNIRDAEISYNRIEDFMMLLRDGAAIYVLGANVDASNARRFNKMHDNYASRELYRDTSKRGYYMDGSSSNWDVYDNVICGVRLPIFSQFHCSGQYTFHNHIENTYSTYPIDRGNHAPWRDTILGVYHDDIADEAEMMEKYPEAAAIRDASGCSLK